MIRKIPEVEDERVTAAVDAINEYKNKFILKSALPKSNTSKSNMGHSKDRQKADSDSDSSSFMIQDETGT